MDADPGDRGRWPHPLLQFLWDLLPSVLVPDNSGLRAPEFRQPVFQAPLGREELETILAVARDANGAAHARYAAAEERAGRLRTVTLALLGVAIGLVAYLFTKEPGVIVWIGRGLALAAVAFLILGGIEALEVELRVGLVEPPALEDLHAGASILLHAVALERDRQVVNWSARNKLNRFLQARAWLSRALVLLIAAAIIAAVAAPPGTHERTTPRNLSMGLRHFSARV